ncbi:MAG: hypothetical protein ACRDLT_05535 [Solirubrobacteraceae bacterium]
MASRLVLQAVVPLGAVPGRLRSAVVEAIKPWGYSWGEVTFAGTAQLPPGQHSRLGPASDEVWVFAVTVGALQIGDELEAAGSRAAGLSLSAFSGGVIPVTPFQGRVYEYLGGHGGNSRPQPPAPEGLPTIPDTERAAPDRPG